MRYLRYVVKTYAQKIAFPSHAGRFYGQLYQYSNFGNEIQSSRQYNLLIRKHIGHGLITERILTESTKLAFQILRLVIVHCRHRSFGKGKLKRGKLMGNMTTTICIAISVMISLKIIDFSHLEFLDVCIIILFLITTIIQFHNHFRRQD